MVPTGMARLLLLTKPIFFSLWIGVGLVVLFGMAAVLILYHGVTEWLPIFAWGLFGLSFILACFQSWCLGLRWSARNTRKELIESLSELNEALVLSETSGRVIYETDAFRSLIRSVNWDDLLGIVNLSSLGELISPKDD